MTDYIVLVDLPYCPNQAPQVPGVEANNVIVIKVPPSVHSPRLGHLGTDEATRREHPEKWMVNNVLPKYPTATVTLYKLSESYEPSTHKKRGE